MAVQTTSANYRICATCVYWTGNRAPKGSTGAFLDVDLDSKGKCAPSGGRPHSITVGKGTCSKHAKWAALR